MNESNGHRYAKADEELTDYFTSAVGLSAIPYEPRSTGGEYEGDVNLLKPQNTKAMARHSAAETSLALVSLDVRLTVTLVYAPHGTGFGRLAGVEGPDLLAMALVPPWGGGSFVRLAMASERVLRAYARRHPGTSMDPGRLLGFLAAEAGFGEPKARFFKAVREECEGHRLNALAAYDVVRQDRVGREVMQRAAQRRKANELYEFHREKARAREAIRFERMIRGAA